MHEPLVRTGTGYGRRIRVADSEGAGEARRPVYELHPSCRPGPARLTGQSITKGGQAGEKLLLFVDRRTPSDGLLFWGVKFES